jgi:2Fe-2S ferredoxin
MRVEPLGVEIEVHAGESLIRAAWRNGYEWPTLCFAMGTCTACRCEILEGAERLSERTEAEIALLNDARERVRRINPRRLRLACQTTTTGDIAVRKAGVRQKISPNK